MIKSRTIFIGDIHGCYDEFKALIKKINVQEDDKVYIVGDMINKGPKSYKVINYIYKHKKQFKAIQGNHEVGFINWLNGEAPKYNCEIYRKLRKDLEEHPKKLEYIKNLPYFIEEDDFIVVHGGIKFDKELKEQKNKDLITLREYKGKLWYNLYTGTKKIIYGHNAIDGLQVRENTVGLDSGCVYGKSLTAYILETGEIYSQNSYSIYESVYTKKSIITKIKNIFK